MLLDISYIDTVERVITDTIYVNVYDTIFTYIGDTINAQVVNDTTSAIPIDIFRSAAIPINDVSPGNAFMDIVLPILGTLIPIIALIVEIVCARRERKKMDEIREMNDNKVRIAAWLENEKEEKQQYYIDCHAKLSNALNNIIQLQTPIAENELQNAINIVSVILDEDSPKLYPLYKTTIESIKGNLLNYKANADLKIREQIFKLYKRLPDSLQEVQLNIE